MRCSECDELLELTTLPDVQAESDGVAVELVGVRGLACSAPDHPRRFATENFPADLLTAVLSGPELPVVGRKGLLRKRDACHRCGGAVPEAEARAEVLTRLRLEPLPAFTLGATAPARTCAGCGLVQLAPEQRLFVAAAVEQALEIALL